MSRKNIALLSGVGLGLLIGICIGLSISQVVGIVLASLTSLLAAYFGLKPQTEQSDQSGERLLIMTGFSFACLISILASVYIRANNLLSPSKITILTELKDLGFSDAESKKILLYKEYNIVSDGMQISDQPSPFIQQSSVLMNSTETYNALKDLEQSKFASVEAQLEGFKLRGGKYKMFADTLERYVTDRSYQQAIIQSTLNLVLKDE
jgi:hypothetical protein